MAPLVLAGLSTGHKIGLAAMAAVLIGFALASSFVAPRRNPSFPGRGLSVFVVTCFVLFAAMITAVVFFGREAEASGRHEAGPAAPAKRTLTVVESEYRIQLPPGTVVGGTYVLNVQNHGKQVHNLYVKGAGVASAHTPDIQPGQSAKLHVTLRVGSYALWCNIPGHKQLGMRATLPVSSS